MFSNEKSKAAHLKKTQHLRNICLKGATFAIRQIKCTQKQVIFIGMSNESFSKHIIYVSSYLKIKDLFFACLVTES